MPYIVPIFSFDKGNAGQVFPVEPKENFAAQIGGNCTFLYYDCIHMIDTYCNMYFNSDWALNTLAQKLSIIYIPPNKRTSERQLSDHSVRFLKQIWLIMIFLYFISFSNSVKPMRPNPMVSEVSPTIFTHLFVLMNVITLIITTATFMLLTFTFTLLQARASSGWFSKHDCSNEDQCKGQYNGSCPHGSLGKSRPFCNKI